MTRSTTLTFGGTTVLMVTLWVRHLASEMSIMPAPEEKNSLASFWELEVLAPAEALNAPKPTSASTEALTLEDSASAMGNMGIQ